MNKEKPIEVGGPGQNVVEIEHNGRRYSLSDEAGVLTIRLDLDSKRGRNHRYILAQPMAGNAMGIVAYRTQAKLVAALDGEI